MKNTIKILSICLLGLTALMMSCGKAEVPFPEAENAERTAFIHFFKIDSPLLITSVASETTTITLGAMLHPYGTDNFTSIDICVVKNRSTDGWRSATLNTVTSLSLTDTAKFTYTLRELLDATGGGGLVSDDQFSFYYTVHTKAGKVFPGWTKLTGFTTTDYAAIPIVPNESEMLGSNWSFNVVCGILFDDLLGEWEVNTGTWWAETYTLNAAEDPEKPGAGLIFTCTSPGSGGSPAFDRTLKVSIDMSSYKFDFPTGQIIYADASWWNASYSNVSWAGGAGDLLTCGSPSFGFSSPWNLWVSGESGYSFTGSNAAMTFTKK